MSKLRKIMIMSLMAGSLTFTPEIYYSHLMPIAHAEIETYVGTGTAMFDFGEDDENIVNAVKICAKERAERNAIEKAGVYIQNYSKTKKFKLVNNEVKTITNNIVDHVKVEYKKLPFKAYDVKNNALGKIGVMYEATVTVKIDTSGIKNYLNRNEDDKKTLTKKNEGTDNAKLANDNKFTKLSNLSKTANTKYDQAKIKEELKNITNDFKVNQKFAEGNKHYYEKDFSAAEKSYNEAVKIKTFNSVGEYVIEANRSEDFAKDVAKHYAERDIQEQAVIFIMCYASTQNIKLNTDKLNEIVADKIKVIDVKYERIVRKIDDTDLLFLRANVTAQIDFDRLNEIMMMFVNDNRPKSFELETNKRVEELKNAIAKLESNKKQ